MVQIKILTYFSYIWGNQGKWNVWLEDVIDFSPSHQINLFNF
jgi:hypothetical protein